MDKALVNECVHCGFCLPTCPTYVLWNEEMDSPRGRIYLMEALVDGTMRLSPTVIGHFDRCLGCMACVTACPSGVKYDRLIELTRAHVEKNIQRSRGERALRSLVFRVVPLSAADARWRSPSSRSGGGCPFRGAFAPLLEIAPPWRSAEAPAAVTPAAGERVRAGRPPDGLCPARRLRRRERRDRARARSRRVRGRRPRPAALLRRALGARRPARGGARAGATADRRVREGATSTSS